MIWEGINVNLKATNIELTEAIEEYVFKKMTSLGNLLTKQKEEGRDILVYFEVSKTTNHHKAGQIYRADCSVVIDGENFYGHTEEEDLYSAIDKVKDTLFSEIKKGRNKKTSLLRRSAQKIKNILKGLGGR